MTHVLSCVRVMGLTQCDEDEFSGDVQSSVDARDAMSLAVYKIKIPMNAHVERDLGNVRKFRVHSTSL